MLRTPRQAKASILQEATSRKFDGGLNVADAQLNLTSKYAAQLENLVTGIDGTLQLTQGTRLFCDLSTVSNYPVLGMAYFAGYLIVMNTNGELFAIDGNGTPTVIWDATVANHRRAGLTTWGGTDYVTFEEFGGALILGNGVDKPLTVPIDLSVDYLADAGTGTNINVPVGKVMAQFSLHLCIADGYTLNVSERSAAGTWTGDPGVNFANTFDMRSYVVKGDTTIIALIPFKSFLLVMFKECIVPVQFKEDATASPKLQLDVSADSVIINYGAISPKVVQDIGDSVLSTDIVGCSSIALSRFTKILAPDRPSRMIDKLLQKNINSLDADTLEKQVFSLYDRKGSSYQLFLPDANGSLQMRTVCYNYKYIDRLDLEAWSLRTNWNWQCGARSSEGRIFFARKNDLSIFVRGDEVLDPLAADYIGEQETFTDGTDFTDGTGLSPVVDYYDSGIPIPWVWELPWTALGHRAHSKTLRYVILDTEGSGEIKLKVFIDDFYTKYDAGEEFSDGTTYDDGTGHNPRDEPLFANVLEADFVAKDHGGFGTEQYGSDLYGGGNNTGVRKLTLLPTKGNTFKLRFEGESTRPIKFVAITLLYQGGTIRRLPL